MDSGESSSHEHAQLVPPAAAGRVRRGTVPDEQRARRGGRPARVDHGDDPRRLEREASLIPVPGNEDSPSILLGSEWYTLGSTLRDAAGEVLPARVVGIEPDALRVRLESYDGAPEPTLELR